MDIIHGDALEVDMETVCHEYVKKRDWEDGMNNNYVSSVKRSRREPQQNVVLDVLWTLILSLFRSSRVPRDRQPPIQCLHPSPVAVVGHDPWQTWSLLLRQVNTHPHLPERSG